MLRQASAPIVNTLNMGAGVAYYDEDDEEDFPTELDTPDGYIYEDEHTLQLLGKRLSSMNAFATNDAPIPAPTIVRYLESSKLSLRALALTFNILANYRVETPFTVLKRQDSHQSSPTKASADSPALQHRAASEIVFVAAMRLASTYLEERPLSAAWWSSAVTAHAFSADDISAVAVDLYASVGWKVPIWALPDAIDGALGVPVEQTKRSMSMPDAKAISRARSKFASGMLTPPQEMATIRESYF